MFVNIPRLDELPEQERAQVTERIFKEIVTAHNREMDAIREEMRRGNESTEENT